jgi:hypothetical protein
MIVSVSRRGDIPAFHSDWFMEQLRRGEVRVGNPFRPAEGKLVSLKKEAVDAIVFWSRDPRPLMGHLPEIERGGYAYYFLLTVTGYPRVLEPGTPEPETAASFFRELAERIGRRRVIWRYDPVIFSEPTDFAFHASNFRRLADLLAPYASRVVVSFFDPYPKLLRRMKNAGLDAKAAAGSPARQSELLARLAVAAGSFGLEIQTCAEVVLPSGMRLGTNARRLVGPGKCIDETLLNELFGLQLAYRKDPAQRKLCLCQRSVDIGSYGTCRHGCIYCYAC